VGCYLIFILWKKIGSSPGTRKSDGKKYISGTEEEFDKAFAANAKNGTGLPFIMVYQKKDELSITNLKPKEIGQYRKMVEFIEECQSGGKHQVLTRSFLSKEFEGLLRKNLLDTILRLSISTKENRKRSKRKGKPSRATTRPAPDEIVEHSSMASWLAKNNLSANPFKYQSAENEKDLVKYYVPFKGFPLISNEIVQGGKNWLFFGKEGSGKTALKHFILSKCAPSRPNSKILAVSYETGDFLEALTSTTDIKEALLQVARQIVEIICKAAKISPKKGARIRRLSEPTMIFLRLDKILYELKGYEQTLCLLDLAPDINHDYILTLTEVLANFVSLPSENIGFRLFLPKSLQTRFIRQNKYLGKCDLREIRWDEKDLKELIKQRLIFYSKNKTNPLQSLAPLCEPKGKMRSIDDEIVGLSQGNPRAVIWLINQLFLEHCQNSPTSSQISSQSWDKVFVSWLSTGKTLILGPSGNKDSFFIGGSEIYFKNSEKPLKLSKRSKLLLKPMVDADGQICSKDEMIRSAWPGVNPEGVTDAAVREAIRRLKVELKEKNNIDSTWVETIHGQGYHLLDPQEYISIGGNATNSAIVQGNNNRINLRVDKRAKDKEDV